MAEAVTACVHCGFCLPTCPTYRELGQEMDSPRGRIILMKEVLEGQLELEDALPHIDQCLGCLACEPACPSGVSYRDLISPFRARAETERKRSTLERLRRKLISSTIPYPARFAFGARFARMAKPLAGLLPKKFRPFFDLLPDQIPPRDALQNRYVPERQTPRARVALLTGCVQEALAPEINRDAIEVLLANGVEVIVPPAQGCCGALAWHVGDGETARKFADANLDAFAEDLANIDAVVSTAAGCGSGLQEYELILAGTGRESEAKEFATKVTDISAFLSQIGLDPMPSEWSEPMKIAYHDACHLSNAQGITEEPRELLRSIKNITLVEIANAQICCGSAGTYNLDQPDIAASLGQQKAKAVLETGANIVATGNIGCLSQLRHHMKVIAGDNAPEIVHTISLLARAYRRKP